VQVVVEEMPGVGGEELAQVVPDSIVGSITQRVGGGGIDGEKVSGQIVRADQTQAVLDQFAISPFAVMKRIAGYLPRRGDPVNRRGLPGRQMFRVGLFTAMRVVHQPLDRRDYTATTFRIWN
jgi:hypothetical protein